MAKKSQRAVYQSNHRKQYGLGEAIRRELSDAFLRDDLTSAKLSLRMVTVVEVIVSRDYRHAKVFIVPLNGQFQDQYIKWLNENTKSFRRLIANKVNAKYTPEISFALDTRFDYADKIQSLLNEIDSDDGNATRLDD